MDRIQHSFRLLAVPVLLIISACIGYCSILYQWNYDLVVSGTLVFVMLYILVCEKIIPLKMAWEENRMDIKTDLIYFVIAAILSGVAAFASLSLMLRLHDWLDLELTIWNSLPFVLVFIVANLIGEFIPYWYHRISHIANQKSGISMFLWNMHAIHHIPTRMNLLKTNWMHPINMFVNIFTKLFPLQLLGFNKEIIFTVGLLNMIIAYLSHANISVRTGILDYIIVTPAIHHFHHSTNRKEALNYSNILPFWDLVFGTYFNNGKSVSQVGIFKDDNAPYPKLNQIGKHMLFPFQRKNLDHS
ncbi:MAG: sterol desaturase family protein [Bacteroidota bacterium]